MECEALKRVRDDMGLTQRRDHGALRAHPGPGRAGDRDAGRARPEARRGRPALIMMCEVPSNAILAEQFLRALRRHVDRLQRPDAAHARPRPRLRASSCWRGDFDERDPAVKAMISRAIAACRATGKYVGICGQGPSDHPDFADWLAARGHRLDLAEPGQRGRDLAAAGGALARVAPRHLLEQPLG